MGMYTQSWAIFQTGIINPISFAGLEAQSSSAQDGIQCPFLKNLPSSPTSSILGQKESSPSSS
jgi:hypothetical protein